jgi:hypothetical protein
VTRLLGTPVLLFSDAEVAVTAHQSLDIIAGDEKVVVEVLAEPGGLPLARFYGTPEALGAFAAAIGEALDLLVLTPLDEHHRRDAAVVRHVREPSSE